MRPSTLRGLLVPGLPRAWPLVLFGLLLAGQAVAHDPDPLRHITSSPAEARKKKTLVCELKVTPDTIMYNGKKITFESAWLEKTPDSELGKYALCFRLCKGEEIFRTNPDPFFVLDDKMRAFRERRSRGRIQFIEDLESPDVSTIRATLMTHWESKRKRDIKFTKK